MTTVEARYQSPSISQERMPLTANIVEFKVGLFRSQGRLGRAAQSVGTYILPGDTSSIRHPISSGARSALFPGGGGGGPLRLGRAIGNAAQRVRCPSGTEFGGRFANADLSNCGRQLFEQVSSAVTRTAERAGAAARGAVSNVPGSPNAPRGVVRSIDGRIIPMRAVQISRNASIPKVGALRSAQRESGIGAAASEVANSASESVRLVRRDGVQLQPVVSLDILRSIRKNDDMDNGAIIANVKNPATMGNNEIPVLLNSPISSAVFALGNGASLRLDKDRPLTIGERRELSRTWDSLKNAEEFDYASRLSQLADESDALTFSSRFPGIEKPMERLSIQNADGQVRNVPRWIYEFYLSTSAPYRGNKEPWQIVVSEGAKPNNLNKKPQATPGSKSLQSSDRLSIFDQPLVRSSQDAWTNSVDFKTAAFANEKNYAGYVFETKRAAAVWDPDLPPSGGWRCPPGTRYGGRISDRFGRNCGYGVVRRLAAGMERLGRNIGEGLDDRRDRRVAARAARVERRISRQEGRVERAQARLERLRGQLAAPGVAGAADRAGMATRLERFADRVDGGYGRRRQRRGAGAATRLEEFADRVEAGGRDRGRRVRRRQRQQQGPGAATRLEQFADRVDGGYGRNRRRRQRRGPGAATRLERFADRVDGGYGRRRRERGQRERRGPGLATRLDRFADRVDFGYGRDRDRRDDARVPARPIPQGGRRIPNQGMRDDFRRPFIPGQDDGAAADISDIPFMSDEQLDRERQDIINMQGRRDGDVGGGRRRRERLRAIDREIARRKRGGQRRERDERSDSDVLADFLNRERDRQPRPEPGQGRQPRPEPQRPNVDPDRYPPQGRERPVAPMAPNAQMPENVRRVWRENDKDRRKEQLGQMSWAELRDYEARLKYEREIADRGGDNQVIADLAVRRNELANERRKRWRERRNAEGQQQPGRPRQPRQPRQPEPQRPAERDVVPAPRPAPAVPQAQRDADGNWPEPRGLSGNGDLPEDVKNIWRKTDSDERKNALKDMSDEDIETYRQRLIHEEDLALRSENDNERAQQVAVLQQRKREIQSEKRRRAREGNRNRGGQRQRDTGQERQDARNAYLAPEIESLANMQQRQERRNKMRELNDSDLNRYKRYVSALPNGRDKDIRLEEINHEEQRRALPIAARRVTEITNDDDRKAALRNLSDEELNAYSDYVNDNPDNVIRNLRMREVGDERLRRRNRPAAEPAGQGEAPRDTRQQIEDIRNQYLNVAAVEEVANIQNRPNRVKKLRGLNDGDLRRYKEYVVALPDGREDKETRLAEIEHEEMRRRLPAAARFITEIERADDRKDELRSLLNEELDAYSDYVSAHPDNVIKALLRSEIVDERVRRGRPATPQNAQQAAESAQPASGVAPRPIFEETNPERRKRALRDMSEDDLDDYLFELNNRRARGGNAEDNARWAELQEVLRERGLAGEASAPGTETRGRAQAAERAAAAAAQDAREERVRAQARLNDFNNTVGEKIGARRDQIERWLASRDDRDLSALTYEDIDKIFDALGDFSPTAEREYRAEMNDVLDALNAELDRRGINVPQRDQGAARPATKQPAKKKPAKRTSRPRLRLVEGVRKWRKPDPKGVKARENDQKLGEIGADGLPGIRAVEIGNAGLDSQTKANDHLANGGDIRDVPDDFLLEAMKANASGSGIGKRFKIKPSLGGVNGEEGNSWQFTDQATGKRFFVKYEEYSYAADEDLNEIVGNNIAARLGFPVGEFRFAGPMREARQSTWSEGGWMGRAIILEHVENYIDGTSEEPSGVDLIKFEDTIRATILDYLILNTDRHYNNYFVTFQDGEIRFVPIDPSLGFGAEGRDFDEPRSYGGKEGMREWINGELGGNRGNNFLDLMRSDVNRGRKSMEDVAEQVRLLQDRLREAEERLPFRQFAEDVVAARGGDPAPNIVDYGPQRLQEFLDMDPNLVADIMILGWA